MPFERALDLPSYKQPPVHEVAVGIGFKNLQCWNSVAPGEFRELLGQKYPKIEDHTPLPPLPATLGGSSEIHFTDIPPVRRTWFLSQDERTLIQMQADRIHVNWRRVQEGDVYPRYGHVFNEFDFALKALERFAADRGNQIQVTAGEVTYVNNIVEGELWSNWNDLSGVFVDWLPTPRQAVGAVSLGSTISLIPSEGCGLVSPGHHLTLDLKSAERVNDKAKVLVFQLVNRGPLDSPEFETVKAWCGHASEDIVRTFTALTTTKAHEVWRRVR